MSFDQLTALNSQKSEKKTIQIPIENNFICLRSLNPNRTRFEVEYSLEKGSCTNSFLLRSQTNINHNSEEVILIHPPGLTFEK